MSETGVVKRYTISQNLNLASTSIYDPKCALLHIGIFTIGYLSIS